MDPMLIDIESATASITPHAAPPLTLLTNTKVSDVPRVRILIVGDSGVGKSCLTARMAGTSVQEIKSNPYSCMNMGSTTGCQTECKLYSYRGGGHGGSTTTINAHSLYHTPTSGALQHRTIHTPSASGTGGGANSSLYFIELFDISGHRRYALSRDVFYTGIHGVIFVFDLMNRKSYENIRRWMKELAQIDKERGIEEKLSFETNNDRLPSSSANPPHQRSNSRPGATSNSASPHHSPAIRPTLTPQLNSQPSSLPPTAATSSPLGSLPVFIIGNKSDEYRPKLNEQGVYDAVKDYSGVDCIYMSALDPKEDFSALDRFYDQVISRRYFGSVVGPSRSLRPPTFNSPTSINSPSSSMAYQMQELSQVGMGMMNSRRMTPYNSKPPVPTSSYSSERRGSSADSNPYLSNSSSQFMPPPIRTLAEFTVDVGSSPTSDSSPSVLSPSSSFDDPNSFRLLDPSTIPNNRPSMSMTSSAYYPPGSLLHSMQQASSNSSLPVNTALQALTQQQQQRPRNNGPR